MDISKIQAYQEWRKLMERRYGKLVYVSAVNGGCK